MFKYFLSYEVYNKNKSVCVADGIAELNHKIDSFKILNEVKDQLKRDAVQRFKQRYKNLFVHILSLTYLEEGGSCEHNKPQTNKGENLNGEN